MSGINFGTKASNYEESGLVQKLNADILLDLAGIKGHGNVLDLGCGPGGVTAKIAGLTEGRVVGVDLSAGMIKQAKSTHNQITNLEFEVKDAAKLGFINEFDYIFCNSAFQWFHYPEIVLKGCFQALKPGGAMVIQAPATSHYCPVFIKAIENVASHPETAPIYSHFHSPLLFLNTAHEYTELFTEAGFDVDYSQLRYESNRYSGEQVVDIFKSGAENAYLNQEYYDIKINDAYINKCRAIIRSAIHSLANREEMIDLIFTRIYIKARKQK